MAAKECINLLMMSWTIFLMQVLVRVLKLPQPRSGLVTKPAPTAVMAAWALGYWARKGASHADAVLSAGEPLHSFCWHAWAGVLTVVYIRGL